MISLRRYWGPGSSDSENGCLIASTIAYEIATSLCRASGPRQRKLDFLSTYCSGFLSKHEKNTNIILLRVKVKPSNSSFHLFFVQYSELVCNDSPLVHSQGIKCGLGCKDPDSSDPRAGKKVKERDAEMRSLLPQLTLNPRDVNRSCPNP